MKLLTRLYDCTSGEVTLDGINVRSFEPDELRRAYSVVTQDVFLFSESVRNNIAMYDESAPDEKIRAAAADACVDKFVDSLDNGYGRKRSGTERRTKAARFDCKSAVKGRADNTPRRLYLRA